MQIMITGFLSLANEGEAVTVCSVPSLTAK